MNLKNYVTEYIEFKQSMGMRFRAESVILKAFCKSVGDTDIKEINSQAVTSYLNGTGQITTFWHRKFEALNGFYRYAIGRNYVNHCPLPTLLPKRPEAFVPYIYSTEEFHCLLAATNILDDRKIHVDAATFRTLLLLLFNTGLRISEALNLQLDDVEMHKNLLIIRDTKFFKTRMVPVSSKLSIVLDNYKAHRRILVHTQKTHSVFFVKCNGLALTRNCAERTFRVLCNHAGICREDGARYQPRLHDIRHTYTTSRLLDWYRKGENINRLLPYLSTYLGHVNISATQRYLSMTPEVLREACQLFESYALSEVKNHA